MKVGIIHGAGINPDGSLQLHTKARADTAIEAYHDSIVDILIVCGKNEADLIASYILKKGIDEGKIVVEPFSYSTLSNLYYCKILLPLIANLEPIDKVYPISNYWHIPRLSFDAGRILGNKYRVKCISACDPRSEKEIKNDERLEKFKSISDRILLSLGYGEECRDQLASTVLDGVPRKVSESIINAIPSYQKKLMKLEKLLYKVMRIF